MNKIQVLVQAFLADLVKRVEEDVRQRLQDALGGVFTSSPAKAAPRDAKAVKVAAAAPEPKRVIKRKKPPKQFCPVPGCKNVAAPIFGMVCGEHKNVAKSKIAKYRLARKQAKAEGRPVSPPAAKAKAKKPVAKKPVAKKPVAKKTVAKKTVAKKTVAKKTVAKKTVAKKTVAKKTVAKKPVAAKTTEAATKKPTTEAAQSSS